MHDFIKDEEVFVIPDKSVKFFNSEKNFPYNPYMNDSMFDTIHQGKPIFVSKTTNSTDNRIHLYIESKSVPWNWDKRWFVGRKQTEYVDENII